MDCYIKIVLRPSYKVLYRILLRYKLYLNNEKYTNSIYCNLYHC